MSIWKEPNSKNAFILSWVSTLITIVFAIIGIVYYNVSLNYDSPPMCMQGVHVKLSKVK